MSKFRVFFTAHSEPKSKPIDPVPVTLIPPRPAALPASSELAPANPGGGGASTAAGRRRYAWKEAGLVIAASSQR